MLDFFPRCQVLALGLLAVFVAGCAHTPESMAENDPLEPMNRAIFDFNIKLDNNVALPLAKGYRAVTPEVVRDGVHNFLVNIALPVTFANDVLQGEVKRGAQTVGRLAINTTLGVGGLIDVATKFGIPAHTEDFGQTLGVYGVPEGPYLMLPLLGPVPPRDLVGQVADIFTDPITYVQFAGKTGWVIAREGVTIVDERERNIELLDQIQQGAVDYYATVRSLYRQHREAEIHNGSMAPEDLPNF